MATAKLKRRLEDADERTLAKLTENFCMIGTPLPALDSAKKDQNEFKPLWQQEVRDEQGRQRLHGAFTGGWSAGYYNTVGSKEGWAPSTFRSSRADRASGKPQAQQQRRPEDYMDEEDLAELRDARKLGTTDTYAEPSAQERDPLLGALGAPDDSCLGGALDDLIRPASTSLGVRLLKRMGWREGQGLGPRISAARRRRLLALQAGPSTSSKRADDPDEDVHPDEEAKHLFAPPDSRLIVISPKDDTKGLGWTAQAGLGDILREVHAAKGREKTDTRKDAEARGGGFGLSAFEEDSDGEDAVYARADDIRDSTLAAGSRIPSRSHIAHGDDEIMTIGNASMRGQSSTSGASQREGLPVRHGTGEEDANTWHDGRPVLRGFHIASRQPGKEPWFEPPPVPKDWKPNPQRVWATDEAMQKADGKENAGIAPLGAAVGGASAARNLRPEERGSLLGEQRMPGPPPSILDYLSAKDRDRLQAASEAAKVDRNAPALPKTAEIAVDVPFTDPATASAALRGFMPFGDDLVKQERYRRYLTSQADPSAGAAMKFTPLVGQSAEQLNRELADFAKSAGIFRPMSTAMASRFTSASSASAASEIAQPAPGLHVPAPKPPEEAKTQEEESARSEEEKLTPAQQAVRMGLFGPLTRTVFEWYPVRLLCKRFNVPDPHPDKAAGTSGDAEADGPDAFAGFGPQGAQGGRGKPPSGRVNSQWEASKRQMEHLAASRAWERPGGGGPATPARASSSPAGTPGPGGAATEGSPAPARRDAAPPSLANVGLGDDEEQGRDTLTYVKPPMDIFKAIFASDDEDEEELETKSEAPKSKGQTKKSTSTQVVSKTPAATDAIADVADQSAFRPTFIPRTKRKGLTGDDLEEDEDGGEEGNGMAIPGTGPKRARLEKDGKEEKKKQKKDKDKEKKGKGMLTFSVDDEEGDGLPPAPKLKRDSQGGGKWAHQEALPSKGGENASKRRRDEAEEPKEQRTGLGGDGSSRPARPRASDLF